MQAKQKKIKGEPNLRVHKTGCARSEGYYKIPFSEKVQYLSSVMRQLEVADQKVEQDTVRVIHQFTISILFFSLEFNPCKRL